MAPAQVNTMRTFSYVIVPVSVLATLWVPSGIQFYFLCTATLQWLQSSAFYNPTMRRLLGLAELHPGGVNPNAPQPQPGSWQAPRILDATARPVEVEKKTENPAAAGILDTFKAAKGKISEYNEKSAKKTERRDSSEYEEKRAMQDDEEYLARLEQKIMKRREK